MTSDRTAWLRVLRLLSLLATFVVVFEAASFGALRLLALRDRGVPIQSRTMTAYRSIPWAETYWREQRQQELLGYEVYSYGLVRARPFTGETIVVDRAGIRQTAHTRCDGSAPTVYVFGGSTIWGYGSPDWETIPSHLASRFAADGQRACVLNFGSDGWRADQGVVMLIQELKRPGARRPDVVVFVNGANDVATPFFWTGRVDREWEFLDTKGWHEELMRLRHGSLYYLGMTNTWTLLQRVIKRIEGPRIRHLPPHADRLAREIAQNYLANIRTVEGLSRAYGFRYAFFWQPMSTAGHKTLTAEEKEGTRNGFGTSLRDFPTALQMTFPLVRTAAAGRFHDLADVFDGHTGSVYIDFNHLLPEGNRIVAERIYAVIR